MTSTALTWNGRFIITMDGHVDLPPDRQGVDGPEDAQQRLAFLDALNDVMPNRTLFDIIRSKIRAGEIHTREAADVVLFDGTHEGERWLIKGNSNASAGYFYVEARITEPPTDSETWHRAIDSIQDTLMAMSEYDRNDAIEALRSRFDEIYTRNGNGED